MREPVHPRRRPDPVVSGHGPYEAPGLGVPAEVVLERLGRASTADVEVWAGAGWAGSGTGAVTVWEAGGALVVSEAGVWGPDGARPMRWRAETRWRLDGDGLGVEHVRQGTPATATLDRDAVGRWAARAPHRCGPDRYDVTLELEPDAVVVTWTVSGPCKADRVRTRYA